MIQKSAINRSLIINILLGLALISIPFLTSPDVTTGLQLFNIPPFQKTLVSYILLVVFLYLNYYLLVPKFYLQKKWLLYFIIVVLCYVIILKVPSLFIKTQQGNPFAPPPPPGFSNGKTPLGVFSKDSYFFQFLVTFLLSLFFRIEENLNKVKNENLASEASYLKAQINPHFLFNTLNSLYALALTKSKKAPDAILKLSNLMRYAVSENNQTRISLQKEIAYIKDFISLQKLRLTKNVTLSTNFSGNFSETQIAPLILINFIENAFKYGANNEETSTILINIHVDQEKTLFLNVENTIVDTPKNFEKSTKKGLENTQKRLQILYPNKHNLVISTTTKPTYQVALTIELE